MGRGDDNILFGDYLVKAHQKGKRRSPSDPGQRLTQEERETMLYPMIWEAVQEINGQRERIKLGSLERRSAKSLKLAQVLAKKEVGQEVADFYIAWEGEAMDRKIYGALLRAVAKEGRGNLAAFWSNLFRLSTDEVRSRFIDRHAPNLSAKDKKSLLQSLPKPRRLVVIGDESVVKRPEKGEWRLELVWPDEPY